MALDASVISYKGHWHKHRYIVSWTTADIVLKWLQSFQNIAARLVSG